MPCSRTESCDGFAKDKHRWKRIILLIFRDAMVSLELNIFVVSELLVALSIVIFVWLYDGSVGDR